MFQQYYMNLLESSVIIRNYWKTNRQMPWTTLWLTSGEVKKLAASDLVKAIVKQPNQSLVWSIINCYCSLEMTLCCDCFSLMFNGKKSSSWCITVFFSTSDISLFLFLSFTICLPHYFFKVEALILAFCWYQWSTVFRIRLVLIPNVTLATWNNKCFNWYTAAPISHWRLQEFCRCLALLSELFLRQFVTELFKLFI